MRDSSPQTRDGDVPCLLVVEKIEHFSEFFFWFLTGDGGGEKIDKPFKIDPACTFSVEIADDLIERVSNCF